VRAVELLCAQHQVCAVELGWARAQHKVRAVALGWAEQRVLAV
jgi:hypothetical protein